MASVTDMISAHDIDEIIISTLPTELSKWLRQDIPSRIERNSKIPVTAINTPENSRIRQTISIGDPSDEPSG